ncbi:Fic family protein [Butyrivibrio hungatei]|uniref:Fic family protein n=1 Tax=Butyrivibrio hungatei TaxID=185008 RepID=UPI00040EEC0C|nr:Fic family protein [Butyrivibrio hungatei]
MKDIKKDPFGEYIRNLPPTRKELGQAWSTAIGLQDVDGLKPSEYLYETARKSIEGEISVDEAGNLINSYYESKDGRLAAETRTEEADKVSARIAKLLSEKAFIFSPTQYISIHRELFNGIYSHAGKIRDYNITKKEWVLDGDTVSYGGAIDLRETLDYDFSQERDFKFNGLTMDETIHHLAVFISRLWQIHAFGEGNTRTTAVFFIKYLRMLGFDAENDMFAENSWYFRNALVRANYTNIKEGIYETTEFLEKFLRNLLLGEKHELHNREMHIRGEFLLGHADPINDPINDPIKLDERESRIIELLREDPSLTRAGMAEQLGCSDSTVKRILQNLVDKGAIKRIGSNKKGEWIIL